MGDEGVVLTAQAQGERLELGFVRDGALHTPTPDCFLDGITRRSLITLASEDLGLKVLERSIGRTELYVRYGTPPTRESYDHAATGPGRTRRAPAAAIDRARKE